MTKLLIAKNVQHKHGANDATSKNHKPPLGHRRHVVMPSPHRHQVHSLILMTHLLMLI